MPRQPASARWRWFLAPAVAWAGVVITLLLVFRQQNLFCLRNVASSCNAVTNSAYAKLAGVPLTWIGLTAYASLFVGFLGVGFVQSAATQRWLVQALRAAVGIGALLSVGLVGVQAFVLGAFCTLCLGSALCFFLLAGLMLLPGAGSVESIPRLDFAALPALLLATVGTAAALLALLFSSVVTSDQPKVLATFDGKAITEEDLPLPVRFAIQPREEVAAKLRRDWLGSRLDELVLAAEAKRRSTSPEKLLSIGLFTMMQCETIAADDALRIASNSCRPLK